MASMNSCFALFRNQWLTKASSNKLIYCSICDSLYKGLVHFNKLVLMIDSSYQVQQQLEVQSEQWVQQEYLAVLVAQT